MVVEALVVAVVVLAVEALVADVSPAQSQAALAGPEVERGSTAL